MTIQADVEYAAMTLKHAADTRKALNMPPRQGLMHPSFVVGERAVIVDVPWSLIQEKTETEIVTYIMGKLGS